MTVYFSTVVRVASQEKGGEIIKVDWESKRVIAREAIVPSHPAVHDPNPRGSTRGGRGILVDKDEIFVASYHSLLVFDHDLKLKRRISHPLFANLHELAWDDQDIWATSTEIDLAIKVNQSGQSLASWFPREDPVIANRFHLSPLALDKEKDNRTAFVGMPTAAPSHTHLNAVAIWQGRPLVLLNQFGCVVRLNPTEIVVENTRLKGCHNLLVLSDDFFGLNDTIGRRLHVYDRSGRLCQCIDLTSYPPVRKILHQYVLRDAAWWLAHHGRPFRLFYGIFGKFATARPLFVRGLCKTSKDTLLIGIAPATILEIDWRSGELLDMYTYSNDLHVCVHGLAWIDERSPSLPSHNDTRLGQQHTIAKPA